MVEIEYVNKEFVLGRLTEEEIFCKYMGIDKVDFKKTYKNDKLRTDLKPGCKFFIHGSSGTLYFRDFSWRMFNCFDYVCVLYGLSFKDSIYKISADFNLLKGDIRKTYVEKFKNLPVHKKVYKFEFKEWNSNLLKYWKSYISWITVEHLNKYNIKPLYRYYIDDIVQYTVGYNELAFIYQLDRYKFQVYAPERLKNKLKFLTTENHIFGLKSLDYSKNYVLIIKSYKDFVLSRLLGLNSIGILSESILLDSDTLTKLDHFNIKLTLFDNDWAGKRASSFYRKEYGCVPLLFPKDLEKDLSDNLKEYGENDIWGLIVETAENLNIEI